MNYANILIGFLKAALLGVFLLVLFFAYAFLRYQPQGIDFLGNNNWLHFPGATVTAQGVHFSPVNGVIVHQDGSVGQPNPPVNVAGLHLKVSGDFTITAIITQIDERALLRLYSSPPIVYDQWRLESPSVEITVAAKENTITARTWDGSSSTSMDMRTYDAAVALPLTISVTCQQDQIIISANNHVLGNMPDHGIFKSGTIWFGADTTAGSQGWTLGSLRAEALKNGHVEMVLPATLVADNSDSQSLRNLAGAGKRKITVGAAVSLEPLLINETYRNLALTQFSIWTPENSMKPEFIHPAPDVYDFSESDLLVDTALKNNIAVHGHALVYDKSSPDWMVKSPKDARQEIMVSHIKSVVEHFKGKVVEWDVVNEPFSEKQAPYKNGGSGLENNIWFEAMGENYIDLAFQTAHAADPAAKLYLNDYGLEHDGTHWDAMLTLVKHLKQRGVPIDGVGFETHIYTDGDYTDAGQLTRHMKELAKLGLLTRISEIDVTQDDAKEQVNQYVIALDVCLRASNCTSYTTWGISDLYGSTTRSDRYPTVYGTSLLWDKDMKAKPVYGALQNRLKQ